MFILLITLDKKIAFFCLPEVFCDPKYAKNASSTGALGELTKLPQALVGWVPRSNPTQRLRRFDRRAFGARHLCPLPKTAAPDALELATGLLGVKLRLFRSFCMCCFHSTAPVATKQPGFQSDRLQLVCAASLSVALAGAQL